MNSKTFEKDYAEKLNDNLFNDHHVLEHFASDYPYLLINFSERYAGASINDGEHFFNLLAGLLSDKSNPIYAEIRQYQQEPGKHVYFDEFWTIQHDMQDITIPQLQPTTLPIISWLTSILQSFPHDLKEEAAIFFEQFVRNAERDNATEFSEKAIQRMLSRDPLWNTLQLFRILLLELVITDKRTATLVDRPLLLYYSAWDYLEAATVLQCERVALNNDHYTINEYFLKYQFNAYITLYIALRSKIDVAVTDENDDSGWIIQKLFAKLNSLFSTDSISDQSKLYYMEELFRFYFDAPDYFGKDNLEVIQKARGAMLFQLRDSLDGTLYGDVLEVRRIFNLACNHYDFYRHNNWSNLQPCQTFFIRLLPHSLDYQGRICEM